MNYDPNRDIHNAYHMISNDDYEPQRSNNFEVQITGLNNLTTQDKGNAIDSQVASESIRLAVADSGTPKFSVDTIKIRRGNTEVKFAGAVTFDDTDLVLNDYIGKDIERKVSAWHKTVFNIRNQSIGKASEYKKTCYLIEYSPDHSIVRQWMLVGCWPSSVDYGKYSSTDNSVRQITIGLVYDYAIPLDE